MSNLAPGTVKWNPGTIWYTTKVVDVLDDSGKPTGQKKEVLVSHFRPAEGGILFGLTFSTAATAPSLPAGQYEVGVTAVMADGSESPLLLTETLSTTGIRAIATTWAARSSITAGLTQWRVYKLRKGGSWYYEAVEPETNTLTITSETTGTQSSPPLVTELSGIEMYAVARAASDARPVYELPSVSLQVGDGKFEAAELGMLPNPLVPGGADQVLIELWARSSIGYRTLFIDQVRFLPIFQHRGSLFARIRGDEPSVPLRWTGYGDNLGLSGYRLHVSGLYRRSQLGVLRGSRTSGCQRPGLDCAACTQRKRKCLPSTDALVRHARTDVATDCPGTPLTGLDLCR